MFTRKDQLNRFHEVSLWDIIVVGGGATGLGIAVDGASRGYKTLLLEQSDFAKGTSSRSTKLVHGGVRYLAQGNLRLVNEALQERGILLQNAPHLVKKQSFIIPIYHVHEKMKYLAGLKLYDWLSGRKSFGKSTWMHKEKVIESIPNIQANGLKGGVSYFDGQFDDARLAINLAQTADEQGGVLLNYFHAGDVIKSNGKICGVRAVDLENNVHYELACRSLINATGVFVDDLLQKDAPGSRPLIQASQGVHLVIHKSFLQSSVALMIPQTPDGRVLFAVPWQDHVLLGTTDTALEGHSLEPIALEQEIEFILDTVKSYLSHPPQRKDVLSVFAGLRPLAVAKKDGYPTKEISRNHQLITSSSGMITLTGGKWTTYRKMAEHAVNMAIRIGFLTSMPCMTKKIKIHGCTDVTYTDHFSGYGSDEEAVKMMSIENPELGKRLCDHLPYTAAEVVWAVRYEMARTIEDVLARRLRILFLDARAALSAAPQVGELMKCELGMDDAWKFKQIVTFEKIARHYIITATI